MDQCKIDKINELARKSRTCGLTEEEKALQKALRTEYVEAFKASLTGILDNTSILRPDGTLEKLKRRDDKKKET
jgi:uncharacterized protein YnzC (UPF0291/DUF896 family)